MKEKKYELILQQLQALLEGEHDMIANMANMAALLFHELPDLNWAGFYLMKNNELVLGPFQGKAACMHIPSGKGVCGTCALQRCTQLVENVHTFPNHIACDSASNSEIVVPLIKEKHPAGCFGCRFTYPSQIRYHRSALSGAGCSNIASVSVNMEIGRG